MAAPKTEGTAPLLLASLIRAALGEPTGDDLALLEARLEELEPTPGQNPPPPPPKKNPPPPPPVAKKGYQAQGPDRDGLGRRRTKPFQGGPR